jgi:hypothetical protein
MGSGNLSQSEYVKKVEPAEAGAKSAQKSSGVIEMLFIVRAWLNERGTGTFYADTYSLSDAIEKAQNLRSQGLEVSVGAVTLG